MKDNHFIKHIIVVLEKYILHVKNKKADILFSLYSASVKLCFIKKKLYTENNLNASIIFFHARNSDQFRHVKDMRQKV